MRHRSSQGSGTEQMAASSVSGSVDTARHVAAAERVVDALPGLGRMFIAGDWVHAASGDTMATIDPTTEQEITQVPLAGPVDVDLAVEGALAAQREWARTSPQHRAECLRRLASGLEARSGELAQVEAVDVGISLTGMQREIGNAVGLIDYFAGLAPEIKGSTQELGGGVLDFTLREPYGVVARILPFNHPLQTAASGIAGPLVAGNAIILKPSEYTPLSALWVADVCKEIFPPGLVSVLTGDGATTGNALVEHPKVGRIAFTGGVASARKVLRSAAEQIKVVTLELGGKNPLIVAADADPFAAAAACVQAMNFTRVQGQSCGSPSRVFVHERLSEAFTAALLEQLRNLRLGDPLEASTTMGPLAYAAHYQRVVGHVEIALDQGARLLTGGRRPEGLDTGFFIEPTVFSEVTPDMSLAREEVFGPVVALLTWSDMGSLIETANELDFGLTANIWTDSIRDAMTFVRGVDAGFVYVNGAGQRPLGVPFGGFKQSGIGKENSMSELLSYTREKNVYLDPQVDRG